jgi:hypothetical protein
MAQVVDCVERMLQFRQRCPGAEFDLKPNLFTTRVPGHDEPFRALSLCHLMNALERWFASGTPDGTSRSLCAGTGGVVAGGTPGGTLAGPTSPGGPG